MKLASLAFVLFLSLPLFSQSSFSLGIKGGANLQQVNFDNFNGRQVYADIQSGERELGYHAGAFARGVLGPVVIQPEILFTHIVSTAQASGGQSENQALEISFNRFDIPMLAGLKLGPVILAAGPVGSFNFEERDEVFNKSMEDFTWGYQAVAGIVIKKVTIDFRFEGAFEDTATEIIINDQPFTTDVRANQFIVGLSIDML